MDMSAVQNLISQIQSAYGSDSLLQSRLRKSLIAQTDSAAVDANHSKDGHVVSVSDEAKKKAAAGNGKFQMPTMFGDFIDTMNNADAQTGTNDLSSLTGSAPLSLMNFLDGSD